MTRGGKRKGAGRPRLVEREKTTMPIPVRVTPGAWIRIKKAAATVGETPAQFVRNRLSEAVASVERELR